MFQLKNKSQKKAKELTNDHSQKGILDSTRSISYINDDDLLDREVELALKSSPEENLLLFCEVLSAQLAMRGIDLKNHPVDRVIYYIDRNEEKSQ